jgi:1-aminocyclopropane-1-carboxylate deaminase/D-cysteine desulfhydrase-like pyridoxal-dependent ACC family enzyme
MDESKGKAGPQHESADALGAREQATPEPVTDQTGEAGAAGAGSVSDASEVTSASDDAGGSKSKAAAVAAGTGAAVAGVAGGIAVAARDTRRRVLGIPIGKRSRFQRGASVVADSAGTVVDRVREPARRVGSRFSRDP